MGVKVKGLLREQEADPKDTGREEKREGNASCHQRSQEAILLERVAKHPEAREEE